MKSLAVAAMAALLLGFFFQSCPAPPAQTPAMETPSPTRPAPCLGYITYEDRTLGFSAQYPEGWQTETGDMQDPDTGEPVGKVAEFYSPYDPESSFLQLLDIVVQILGSIEGTRARMPTDQELRQLVTDWVTQREQELVTDPMIVTVDGYRAVRVSYTGTDVFGQYTVVGYATLFMTEDRFFFIEGAAATENQEEMRNIYECFMATFDVLPLR